MERSDNCEEATITQLEKVFPHVMALDLSNSEKCLIEQSHQAFTAILIQLNVKQML